MMVMFKTSLDCLDTIIVHKKWRVSVYKYHIFSTFNSTKPILSNCIFKSKSKEF